MRLVSCLRVLPMLPYTHAQSKSNVCVEFFAECFHTSYLEIVNPPSDELVEFLHFVAVANALAVRLYISHYLGMFG